MELSSCTTSHSREQIRLMLAFILRNFHHMHLRDQRQMYAKKQIVISLTLDISSPN